MIRVTLALVLSTVSTAALAQAAPQAAADVEASSIEEIIVTATRRSENLQKVPVAVTALTQSTLEVASVEAVTRLAQVTPGLLINRNTVAIAPVLRGVGTSSGGPGNESPIAVYIDGVYQPDLQGNQFDLLKVERIEVLRGPQGTLFGRNATGGLINIITPDPSFTPKAELRVRYGRFSERSARFYGSLGLSDTVAVDLSGLYLADNGTSRDIIRGGRAGDRRVLSGRSKFLFKPNDSFKAQLAVSAFDTDDDSLAVAQPFARNTSGRATAPNIILPTRPNEYAGNIAEVRAKGQSVSLELSQDLGGVRVESTTAYIHTFTFLQRDSDQSPGPGDAPISNQGATSYSQEIRLLSDNDGPISWIAGVYGFKSRGVLRPLRVNAAISLTPTTHTESLAGFADVTWKAIDKLSLVGGLRYTSEKRDFVQRLNGNPLFVTAANPSGKQKKKFDNWSPKALVQYFIDDNINVYASWSRAFKSGIFNAQGTAAAPVNPEINTAIEGGLKADPTSWLRFNLAAFHYDYKNLQVSVRPANSPAVLLQNAGKAKMKGLEAEFTLVPLRGLELRSSFSFLDAKYSSLQNVLVQVPLPQGGNTAVLFDASGTRILRAPKFSMSLGANYEYESSAGTFAIGGNAYHSSSVRQNYNGRLSQPSYTLFSGEVSFALPGDNVRFSIWGDNLTNKHVFDSVVSIAAGDLVQYNKPRRIGVAVDLKI